MSQVRRLLMVSALLTVSAGHTISQDVEGVERSERPTMIVVVGADGADEYGAQFREWAERWQVAGERADARIVQIEPSDSEITQRARLEKALEQEARQGVHALWLVMLGHGTFDRKLAKFNLVGPDMAATELKAWLAPIERPMAVIACFSASGPFINRLSAPGRIIVSATKSGYEYNYSRFGDALSSALADNEADLDKDQQVSLLEAFLFASSRTAEFYEREARLATEHALLDDNGDGLGTPADFFRGVRAVKTATEGHLPDGLRAHQLHLVLSSSEQSMPADLRRYRDALEIRVAEVRSQRARLDDDEYYRRLEVVLLELAKIYK